MVAEIQKRLGQIDERHFKGKGEEKTCRSSKTCRTLPFQQPDERERREYPSVETPVVPLSRSRAPSAPAEMATR